MLRPFIAKLRLMWRLITGFFVNIKIRKKLLHFLSFFGNTK